MKKVFSILIVLSFAFVLTSCASYKFTYSTYLDNSNPKSLEYKDSIFTFIFAPVPNGIYFTINNNSKQPAYIIWDKSYFIQPNGNSSKALNYDLLNVATEVLSKSNNESIIPPRSNFARFTTSSTNLSKIKVEDIFRINNYLSNSSYSSIIYSSYYNLGNYWPTEIPNDEYSLDEYLPEIIKYVQKNDNMALGFSLKVNDKTIDYRFDFRFDEIDVYEISSEWSVESAHKVMTAKKEKLWKWEEVN